MDPSLSSANEPTRGPGRLYYVMMVSCGSDCQPGLAVPIWMIRQHSLATYQDTLTAVRSRNGSELCQRAFARPGQALLLHDGPER